MQTSESNVQHLLAFQRNEITEHHIYCRLAAAMKSAQNKELFSFQ
jgi:hypothetical protein